MTMTTCEQLNQGQICALKAVVDALLPPIVKDDVSNSTPEVRIYWATRLSTNVHFMETLTTAICSKISPIDRLLTRSLLSALSTSLGTSILFGVLSMSAFDAKTEEVRTELLQGWRDSSLLPRRRAFNGLKRLICSLAYTFIEPASAANPFWGAMEYAGPPQRYLSAEEDAALVEKAMKQQEPLQQSILTLPPFDQNSEDSKLVLECDVVIVGTGAGGCVAAHTLQAAGYHVIMLEKGRYYPPDQISNLEADAMDKMYENHGLLTSSDGNIILLAGSTVGGGTTINWSCCLPTPPYVRQEWVREHDLVDFNPGGPFERSLEVVTARMGATDRSSVTHNPMNRTLQEGCTALQYPWEATGQNLRIKDLDSNGFICFGDRYGNKENGLQAFLFEAIQGGRTRIVENCHVDRVLTVADRSSTSGKRAVGVECTVSENRKMTVRARKAVILSAGSLQTPCILQRSGFRNRHIGKHLRIHPVTGVVGWIRNPIFCHLGSPLTTVCNQFAMGPDQDGYGVKIECPSGHCGIMATAMAWKSPEHFKHGLARGKYGVPLILIQRDRGEGSVHVGRDGKTLVVDYHINAYDKKSLSKAVRGAYLILLAAGCYEVGSTHSRDSGINWAESSKIDVASLAAHPDLQAHFSELDKVGMKDHEAMFFSAHQMGSCRMSTSAKSGAVDVNGETWECDDLFVMDTSIFPTASGANPMMTGIALSHMLGTRLGTRLRFRDGVAIDEADAREEEIRAERRIYMRSSEKTLMLPALSAIVSKAFGLSVVLLPLVGAWILDPPTWLISRV